MKKLLIIFLSILSIISFSIVGTVHADTPFEIFGSEKAVELTTMFGIRTDGGLVNWKARRRIKFNPTLFESADFDEITFQVISPSGTATFLPIEENVFTLNSEEDLEDQLDEIGFVYYEEDGKVIANIGIDVQFNERFYILAIATNETEKDVAQTSSVSMEYLWKVMQDDDELELAYSEAEANWIEIYLATQDEVDFGRVDESDIQYMVDGEGRLYTLLRKSAFKSIESVEIELSGAELSGTTLFESLSDVIKADTSSVDDEFYFLYNEYETDDGDLSGLVTVYANGEEVPTSVNIDMQFAYQSRIFYLEGLLSGIEDTYLGTISELEAEIEGYDDEIEELEGEIETLETSITEKNNQIISLNSTISTKTARITELENQVEILQNTITNKENQISTLQASVAEIPGLEAEIEELEEELAELEDDYEDALAEIDVLTIEKNALLTENEELEEELEALETSLQGDTASLSALLREAQAKISELNTKNNELKEKNKNLQAQLDAHATEGGFLSGCGGAGGCGGASAGAGGETGFSGPGFGLFLFLGLTAIFGTMVIAWKKLSKDEK